MLHHLALCTIKKQLSLPFGEFCSASRIISVKKETDVSLPRGTQGVRLTPIVPRGALTTILFFITFFFLSAEREGNSWSNSFAITVQTLDTLQIVAEDFFPYSSK